jgi:hypothetical protein
MMGWMVLPTAGTSAFSAVIAYLTITSVGAIVTNGRMEVAMVVSCDISSFAYKHLSEPQAQFCGIGVFPW